jgi:hypothetical protein
LRRKICSFLEKRTKKLGNISVRNWNTKKSAETAVRKSARLRASLGIGPGAGRVNSTIESVNFRNARNEYIAASLLYMVEEGAAIRPYYVSF